MMKKLILIALSLAVLAGGTYAKKEPVDYVNPFVESMQKGYVTEDKPMHVWGGAGRVME